MKTGLLGFGMISAISLAACSSEPSSTLTLVVASDEATVVRATEQVLRARFEELRPTMFSSVKSTISGSRIDFAFHRGAPPPATLAYLYETMGSLRVSLVGEIGGTPWITDGDIEDASVGYSNDQPALFVRVSPAAGGRLAQLTSENVGKVLQTTLDGSVLFEATISGVFGRSFQMPLPTPGPRLSLAAVLENGALPARVVVQGPN